MAKIKLLAVLISLTLVLTLLNLYGISNLNRKLDSISISGGVVAEPETKPALGTDELQQPQRIEASADDDPAKGPENAAVTIIEFSDFQCPYCARFYTQTLPQIEENYINRGKVRLVFRDFPLSFHQYAQKASEAAECADEQGRFWEYHNKLFENNDALDTESLKRYAEELGLDAPEFDDCLDSGKMEAEVKKDFSDGSRYGVSGTPSFFINGVNLVGAQPYSVFEQAIEQALTKK